MIRYAYISNQILTLYRSLDKITFPIDPKIFLYQLGNCKIITYTDFAQLNQCTIQDVITLCKSSSGCTQYDAASNRYLILYNDCPDNNNVPGRIRWTQAHELGHVVLKHFLHDYDPIFEAEADYFASQLLCPMPLFQKLHIQSENDVRETFGLSYEAASCRWKDYLKWKNHHKKTAWENDLRSICRL